MLEKAKYNVTPSNVEKEDIADLGESKQMWRVITFSLVYGLKDMLAQIFGSAPPPRPQMIPSKTFHTK